MLYSYDVIFVGQFLSSKFSTVWEELEELLPLMLLSQASSKIILCNSCFVLLVFAFLFFLSFSVFIFWIGDRPNESENWLDCLYMFRLSARILIHVILLAYLQDLFLQSLQSVGLCAESLQKILEVCFRKYS